MAPETCRVTREWSEHDRGKLKLLLKPDHFVTAPAENLVVQLHVINPETMTVLKVPHQRRVI